MKKHQAVSKDVVSTLIGKRRRFRRNLAEIDGRTTGKKITRSLPRHPRQTDFERGPSAPVRGEPPLSL